MAEIINKSSFDDKVRNSSDVVLVDFFATWCGPCQALIPIIDQLSTEVPENAKVYKIDVDQEPELASEFGIMSIPALKVFKGGKVVEEAMGVRPKEDLLKMIENHL